jgi:putative hydrolase
VATGRHTGRELGCRDDPDHGSGHDSGRVLDRSSRHDDAAEPASVWVGPTRDASAASPSNGDLGELLRRAAREETDHRRRALERASRASRFWPEEAGEVAGSGRPLTELRAVGPWVAARIEAWLEDPPAPEPDETRRGFLTYAQVRRTLDADPAWESTPCADLQMHTTWSDGTLPLEDMVEASRSLGRPFVAVTDHSQALSIANGMTPAELAEQARVIDALNRGFEEEGDAFRVLRSMEVDLFADGTLDMDDDSLASLDLVLGAFHSELRSKDDQTDRYLAALNQPRLDVLAHPKARMYGRRVGLVADWRRVFAEAARSGKALELDATVWRQDLNVELATLAREEGVEWFTIGSDAHAARELELLPFGMAIAALAGIPRERILNYQPLEFVRRWGHRSQG